MTGPVNYLKRLFFAGLPTLHCRPSKQLDFDRPSPGSPLVVPNIMTGRNTIFSTVRPERIIYDRGCQCTVDSSGLGKI